MKLEIKNRWSGEIAFSLECGSVKECVEKAFEDGADLSGAVLRDADLSDAVLRGADLSDAVLRGAVLRGADLSGADLRGAVLRDAVLSDAVLSDADLSDAVLRGAVLRDADLSDAVLRDAVLSGADLRGADLSGADLSGADLRDAVLRDADLSDAVLTSIRDDLWAVLSSAPKEVQSLRDALADGRVDGSTYHGSCACLVGTLANARKCEYDEIDGLTPDSSRPAERFFLCIKAGDTPETNQSSKLALEWVDQWLANVRAAFV